MIRAAKQAGIAVTCEVTPHHLMLNEMEVLGFMPEAKVNPPLRTEQDRRALWRALIHGTIDVIATDHAPHSATEKEVAFQDAAPGMIGLETALAAVWTLSQEMKIDPLTILAKLTCNPAAILRLGGKGRLEVGADADVTIFAPDRAWRVDPEQFRSRSRNTPLIGRTLVGKVMRTIVAGEVVYEAGD
jgi:dihydroorotase